MLIETVGVGQDEVEIAGLAQVTVVVLVPGMGDDVQAIKAGIMEIADVFVINKADQPGADRMEQELRAALSLARRAGSRPIVRTGGDAKGNGIAELLDVAGRQSPAACASDGRRRSRSRSARRRSRTTHEPSPSDCEPRAGPAASRAVRVPDLGAAAEQLRASGSAALERAAPRARRPSLRVHRTPPPPEAYCWN